MFFNYNAGDKYKETKQKNEKPKGSIIVISDYDEPVNDASTATSTLAINGKNILITVQSILAYTI